MSSTLDEQIKQLKQTIAEMEEQRSVLGDAFVDTTLNTLRQKLAELEAKAQPSREEPIEIPTRQRKLVTLLYMDVVGSTAMTQHLDPEDTLEIMDNALPRLAVSVEAHGGHVTRYTGDGFKAVFGDPIAREDDPKQAIRAGLEILKDAKALAQELRTDWGIEDFQVRIGIDTGLAALGGRTEAEDTIMGRVVNLAVRIESAAPPGSLLISHNTYRHVRGVFTVEPQEPITAKGFPEPVPVYLVKEIKPRAFRVLTRGVEGVETRMVGRVTELDFLKDALLTAIEEGEGQVITITGEAGVGKSRLLYEFQNWIELLPPPEDVFFFQGRGKQEAQGQPYSLMRDLFAFRYQILDGDTAEGVRRKVETGFGEVFGDEWDARMRAHIIGQWLGFDFSLSPHLKGVLNDPEQLRNRALLYLVEYFQALSKDSPVVIFLEDIHWADDSSLDVVMRLGEYTPQLRLLIVGAARPTLFERRPYWGEGQAYHTHLELHPLSKRESRILVAEILKLAEDIPNELRELVVRGAEGNPFYLEELIKMLIEDGVVIPGEETWRVDLTRLEQVDVPSTLAGVLQARLDSLHPQERTVLQQASVVGRLFWDRIVAYIQAEAGDGGDPELIPLALTSLRNRELVYRHEESAFTGAVEYLFKHDVLREVTYESVLKRLRKTYHGLVVDWLIANSGDRIGEYSGLIAEHLLLAGKSEQACQYFSQAGDSALASYANAEAEGYYRKALELHPPIQLRAALLSGLGETLFRQGQSQEAQPIWQKAIDLYQDLGDSNHLGDIYARLSWLLWHTEDYLKAWNICQEGLGLMKGAPDSHGYARLLAEAGRTAHFRNVTDQVVPLCQRALEMAQRVGDLEVEAEASITLTYMKEDDEESIKTLEKIVALTEREGLLRPASRAHIALGWYLSAYLIDLDSALQHNLRAVENYRLIGDINNFMFALHNVAEQYIELGELNNVKEKLIENLKGVPAHESRIREIFEYWDRGLLSHAKGEWFSALDARRAICKKLRGGSSYQLIINNNFLLVNTILELNRFEHVDELLEAESALMENLEINWEDITSPFLLAIVCTRQKRLEKARDWLNETANTQGQFKEYLANALHLLVENEIALTEEQWSQAVVASKTLIEIYQNSGHRWEWARKLIDLGDVLTGRNEPGDIERARETYQQSLDMFTEMGAPGYIKVLEERLSKF